MRRQVSAAVLISLISLGAVSARPVHASQPSPETIAAFEQYIRAREAADVRTLSDPNRFLVIDGPPEAAGKQSYARLRNAEIMVESNPASGSSPRPIPGGLIHDWIGLVFVPSVSVSQAVAAAQDYDRDADYYAPRVLASKLLQHSNDDFRVFLRLRQTQGITVVFDTEYDIRYTRLDATHVYSRSYSTRAAEVKNVGRKSEYDASPDDDRGLLWRLYTYWRFFEAEGGVYIQCEAISLTRDVPAGLGWIIRPLVERIPRDSLWFTLDATRKALARRFSAAARPSP